MPSNHLILCHPLLLLPSIFPSIRVFSNESALPIRWPMYRSFSFSISPSNEHPGLMSFGWTGWMSLQSKGLSRVFSNTTVQKHQFFGAQLSLSRTNDGGNRQNRLHLESRAPSWARPWTLSYMPSIYGNNIPTGKPDQSCPPPPMEEPQGLYIDSPSTWKNTLIICITE